MMGNTNAATRGGPRVRRRRPSRRAELRRLVAEGADVREVIARLRVPDRDILELHLAGVSNRAAARRLGFKCHRSIGHHLKRPELAYLVERFIRALSESSVHEFFDLEGHRLLLAALTTPTLDAKIALVLRYAPASCDSFPPCVKMRGTWRGGDDDQDDRRR